MNGGRPYFGKYRGVVSDNVDPLHLGRIQAVVADVSHGTPSSWCMPCVPVAGLLSGTYIVPAIGSGVWIEYEHGDPNYPIWVGGFWGPGQLPPPALAAPPGAPPIVIESTAQHALVISDVPVAPLAEGGILLQSGASFIAISPTMIRIVAPTIAIDGALVVNDGALAVAVG